VEEMGQADWHLDSFTPPSVNMMIPLTSKQSWLRSLLE